MLWWCTLIFPGLNHLVGNISLVFNHLPRLCQQYIDFLLKKCGRSAWYTFAQSLCEKKHITHRSLWSCQTIKAWNSQKQMHCWIGLLRAQLNVWWPLIDGYIKWRTAKLQLFCRWKRQCAVIMTNNFCLNHFPEITFIKRRETWVSAREARCSLAFQQISTFSF